MEELIVTEEESPDNGAPNKSQYEELLEDIKKQGVAVDGDKIAREGLQLLSSSPMRQSAVHYLATVAEAGKIYKDNQMLAAILDQMARSIFKSREERLAYLVYLDWVKENDQDYDYGLWYITSAISEGGQSRIDLVAAVTTINMNNRSNSFGNNRKQTNANPNISA